MIPHQRRRLRGACKTNAERTECVHGHPFTNEANLYRYIDRDGNNHRMCRRCNADRAAARIARRKSQ